MEYHLRDRLTLPSFHLLVGILFYGNLTIVGMVDSGWYRTFYGILCGIAV